MTCRGLSLVLAAVLCCSSSVQAQKLVIPRRHDRPPGPPLSAKDAAAKMTVPEGFSVDVVASEPDVVNPVAMFIDEKGRFWVTESFEYPRREPGPGRDRIKVLEDTNGDGKVDKVTVFAEGLNIPSGIAVGHGGVWVANAPDILFLQDTDGDLKADKTEVIVTGFGRTDTHELPNSFTWGPDGWLYGLNGVFNYCDVTYGKDNPNAKPGHPGWKFTCALFRIHPRTREFQVFCEGTSNPWGLAINDKGDFFVSACVIDHLWHLTERGYYIRQGGPYPAHTWPIASIVKHEHQKAAYCGITWFDSDAYPPEYRNTLYMGNIHGNCINADVIETKGATYAGKAHPGFPAKADAWKNDPYGVIRKTGDDKSPKLADLLQANDQWFMPVVQKTGPDVCLYILDWYDQYHCDQDANADPVGIDRGKGRLYRLRYKDNPYT
ncbi:MAG TPA: PVC-type heme-binding CxxCH protein, partial [Caulifigura sp.]|nr:PVC-type heme-binding CxxCH protein [Caulifigura sp.]